VTELLITTLIANQALVLVGKVAEVEAEAQLVTQARQVEMEDIQAVAEAEVVLHLVEVKPVQVVQVVQEE
jgi:hypothetical protein